MELELSHAFDAGADRLWAVLLDPARMSGCVPGMQSVEVVSDTEYRATIKVKIAFISAKFNVRTVITEMTPPEFLVCECAGEDRSVASSVKCMAEMRLTALGEGRTELRVSVKADVLGRLGALGLNPMRTKAERMWAEFCSNVDTLLAPPGAGEAPDPAREPVREALPDTGGGAATARAAAPHGEPVPPRRPGLMAWLRRDGGRPGSIRVELRRAGTTVVLDWPEASAGLCLDWLDRQLAEK